MTRSSRWIAHVPFAAALVLSLAACGGEELVSAPAAPAPRIETTACEFTLPPDQNPDDVTCGNLIVAENRKRPTGRTVSVAFAVFKASGPDPVSDPLVLLPGGPGELELDFVQYDVPDWFGWAHPTRTLVFFDPRGTGYSRPSLDCPEFRVALQAARAKPLTMEEENAAVSDAMRVCRDRLVGDGIDLSAYTSADSARDVHDLMTALGYQSWNAYGLSYGTRMALTLMRDAPQGLRSVVLDSTVPVQANFIADISASGQRSLDLLFASCAGDPSCAALYPDLEQTLSELAAQLNDEPVTLEGTDPATAEALKVVVTGDRLVMFVRNFLYQRGFLGLIPLVITSAAQGSYELLSEFVVHPVPTYNAVGVLFSTLCGEEAPFITPAVLDAATAGVREEIKRALLMGETRFYLDVCTFWGSPEPSASENQPVASDIPALVLAGEYDPITPPAYDRLAAETLSPSYVFDLRAYAHNSLGAGCPDDLRTAFLNAPTSRPEVSCVDLMPPVTFAGTEGSGAQQIQSRTWRGSRLVR